MDETCGTPASLNMSDLVTPSHLLECNAASASVVSRSKPTIEEVEQRIANHEGSSYLQDMIDLGHEHFINAAEGGRSEHQPPKTSPSSYSEAAPSSASESTTAIDDLEKPGIDEVEKQIGIAAGGEVGDSSCRVNERATRQIQQDEGILPGGEVIFAPLNHPSQKALFPVQQEPLFFNNSSEQEKHHLPSHTQKESSTDTQKASLSPSAESCEVEASTCRPEAVTEPATAPTTAVLNSTEQFSEVFPDNLETTADALEFLAKTSGRGMIRPSLIGGIQLRSSQPSALLGPCSESPVLSAGEFPDESSSSTDADGDEDEACAVNNYEQDACCGTGGPLVEGAGTRIDRNDISEEMHSKDNTTTVVSKNRLGDAVDDDPAGASLMNDMIESRADRDTHGPTEAVVEVDRKPHQELFPPGRDRSTVLDCPALQMGKPRESPTAAGNELREVVVVGRPPTMPGTQNSSPELEECEPPERDGNEMKVESALLRSRPTEEYDQQEKQEGTSDARLGHFVVDENDLDNHVDVSLLSASNLRQLPRRYSTSARFDCASEDEPDFITGALERNAGVLTSSAVAADAHLHATDMDANKVAEGFADLALSRAPLTPDSTSVVQRGSQRFQRILAEQERADIAAPRRFHTRARMGTSHPPGTNFLTPKIVHTLMMPPTDSSSTIKSNYRRTSSSTSYCTRNKTASSSANYVTGSTTGTTSGYANKVIGAKELLSDFYNINSATFSASAQSPDFISLATLLPPSATVKMPKSMLYNNHAKKHSKTSFVPASRVGRGGTRPKTPTSCLNNGNNGAQHPGTTNGPPRQPQNVDIEGDHDVETEHDAEDPVATITALKAELAARDLLINEFRRISLEKDAEIAHLQHDLAQKNAQERKLLVQDDRRGVKPELQELKLSEDGYRETEDGDLAISAKDTTLEDASLQPPADKGESSPALFGTEDICLLNAPEVVEDHVDTTRDVSLGSQQQDDHERKHPASTSPEGQQDVLARHFAALAEWYAKHRSASPSRSTASKSTATAISRTSKNTTSSSSSCAQSRSGSKLSNAQSKMKMKSTSKGSTTTTGGLTLLSSAGDSTTCVSGSTNVVDPRRIMKHFYRTAAQNKQEVTGSKETERNQDENPRKMGVAQPPTTTASVPSSLQADVEGGGKSLSKNVSMYGRAGRGKKKVVQIRNDLQQTAPMELHRNTTTSRTSGPSPSSSSLASSGTLQKFSTKPAAKQTESLSQRRRVPQQGEGPAVRYTQEQQSFEPKKSPRTTQVAPGYSVYLKNFTRKIAQEGYQIF
ncbi:unnamed protein product [Amoebophrya sp. A25]|nr:unnamed protein product [Amoebophrya sp. A25]|eukprot:GSA25T00017479001.1